ncbi:hypothetical protein [Streptomyces flavofungini]|uniref:hypothetical protein n=1 Tax=Streptomyces flavofungini TaxID=68200 RepID=UPI00167D8D39|nr:hypothetical protein [Streptomyces flavofungini]GHC89502.1 hypothetical protein GCM10010349_77380 [Streptomyces flavofungini]
MRELLAQIDERQAAGREEAARLREQITQLGEQLAALEHRLERLEITRETVLEIAEDSDPGGLEPLPSTYRQILALFEDDEHGLRAKDICEALGTGTENRHVEGAQAKLKRLVSRGILPKPNPACSPCPDRQGEPARRLTQRPLRSRFALRRIRLAGEVQDQETELRGLLIDLRNALLVGPA